MKDDESLIVIRVADESGSNQTHIDMVENIKSKKELLLEAQFEQTTTIAGCRVTVLKGLDELKSFNGEDDYAANLPIIVSAYPEGIEQSRIREVLPDAVKLAKAVKALKDKEIKVEEISARNIVLKPLKKEPSPPPQQEMVTVDTNPTGNPAWETEANAPSKPTPKSAKSTEEDTEG